METNNQISEIKNGTHPQFIYNSKNNKVECKCGHAAIWFRTGFICGTITAYPCTYSRTKKLLSKEQNIPNYIGWAAMILTADRLGFQAYYTDIAAKVLDTHKTPEVILMASFENEAVRLNNIIIENQKTEEANIIAQKYIDHDW